MHNLQKPKGYIINITTAVVTGDCLVPLIDSEQASTSTWLLKNIFSLKIYFFNLHFNLI